MHSPFTNGFPYFVWALMKRSRVNKDWGDGFCRLLNSTRIYDLVLKRTSGFVATGIGFSIVGSFAFGRLFDRMWCEINKGHLYKDNIYNYPEEEDEDEDE